MRADRARAPGALIALVRRVARLTVAGRRATLATVGRKGGQDTVMHTHSHPPRGIHRWHVVALAVLLATVLLLAVSITPAAAASDAGAPVAALHPFPAQNAPRHAAEAVSVNDGDVAVAISIPAFFLIMTVALFAWAHHNKVDRTAPPSGDDAAAE